MLGRWDVVSKNLLRLTTGKTWSRARLLNTVQWRSIWIRLTTNAREPESDQPVEAWTYPDKARIISRRRRASWREGVISFRRTSRNRISMIGARTDWWIMDQEVAAPTRCMRHITTTQRVSRVYSRNDECKQRQYRKAWLWLNIWMQR